MVSKREQNGLIGMPAATKQRFIWKKIDTLDHQKTENLPEFLLNPVWPDEVIQEDLFI